MESHRAYGPENVALGYQGGTEKKSVSWNPKLGIWWSIDTDLQSPGRFWNAFGIVEDGWDPKRKHTITCEINFAPKGVDRRVAGALARNENGQICVVHRGKIGGGRRGIGKNLFKNHYRGAWEKASDGEEVEEVALLGVLGTERFAQQIGDFVKEVRRIKNFRANTRLFRTPAKLDSGEIEFRPEFAGPRRAYEIRGRIVSEADHGLVVNALERELRSRGFSVGNRGMVDLYASKSGRRDAVFEFKTSGDLTSCYSATGQLFFNAVRLGGNPRMVAVFPTTLPELSRKILERIGIECLTYRWNGEKVEFGGSTLATL